jgi:hypothetical protein
MIMKHLKILVLSALTSFASVLWASDYIPLLQNSKEWGYAEYISKPETNPNAYIRYYRMRTNSTQEIDGHEYTEIVTTNLYSQYEGGLSAYLREDDGKVYVRYTDEDGHDDLNYFSSGKEHLLFDLDMNEGDFLELEPRVGDSEGIVLKCIETGEIETDYVGKRKYLKFDRNVNETTKRWMPFEYIIEGIGPVGNCTLIAPYRDFGNEQIDIDHPQIDFLYQRVTLAADEDYIKPQGAMLYISPLFEVMGPYDPSVWYWKTVPETYYKSSVNNPKIDRFPYKGISIASDNGGSTIVSNGEELTEVTVFDLLGKVLGTYRPNSNEFKVDCGRFDASIVIVRASTASGSRSFKLAL